MSDRVPSIEIYYDAAGYTASAVMEFIRAWFRHSNRIQIERLTYHAE